MATPSQPQKAPGPKAAPAPMAKTLTCTGCGGPLTVRAPGHSLTVACPACGAILDAQDPNYKVIETHAAKTKLRPLLPLGVRGKIRGEPFEVIGFLVRAAEADGEVFRWGEYLLFNPYRGFRWLTEYHGHWILAKVASSHPTEPPGGATSDEGYTVSYLGRPYRHFQSVWARVEYVLGEFPWRVRVGEQTSVEDFIDPPRILSREKTEEETTWSIGESVEGKALWAAFGLKGEPPSREGVGEVQVSPYTAQALFLLLVGAVLLVQILFALLAENRLVQEQRFAYQGGKGPLVPVVTAPFDLTGRQSNVQVEINTDLSNNWAYFNMALINEATGQGLNFGREVSYYSGQDEDGSWSEGGRRDEVYLLIEPETSASGMTYEVHVRRDVPRFIHLLWALPLVSIFPLVFWYRSRRFEAQRWMESDHPMPSLIRVGESQEDDDE
jgi:hypothetical protein